MNKIKLSEETKEVIDAYITLILDDPRMDDVSKIALINTIRDELIGVRQ